MHPRHLFRVGRTVLLYNVAVFAFFSSLYASIGFKKHFFAPADMGNPASQLLYFSAMTHGMVGSSPDVYPKTALARALVSVHVMLVFMQLGGVILFASTL